MSTPFFSIVIPTYNRPELVRDALYSALHQDFDDFEVIVSDNYNDERTQEVIDEYRTFKKLRIFRTPHFLSMPEHWMFATQHTQGEYVLILTDRSVLKRHSLKTIYDAIHSANNQVELCCWRYSAYDDNSKIEVPTKPLTKTRVSHLTAQETIHLFLHQTNDKRALALPLGLNGCYQKSLMKRVKHQFGSPFNRISPDYYSAFIFLGVVPEILYIDEPLFLYQGIDKSNGGTMVTITPEYYLSTLNNIDLKTHLPMNPLLLASLIYDDFLAAQELVSGHLRDIQIDWPCYFEVCYQEILYKKGEGYLSDTKIKEYFEIFYKALHSFDTPIQTAVKRRIKRLTGLRVKTAIKKRLGANFLRLFRSELRRLSSAKANSILTLAGFLQ